MLRVLFAMLPALWSVVGQGQACSQDPAAVNPAVEKYSNSILQMSLVKADSKDPRVANLRTGGIWHEWEFIVILKNISSKPVTLVQTAPECDYAIEVVDSSGTPAAVTARGARLPKSERKNNLTFEA